jgi:hypothetical protein
LNYDGEIIIGTSVDTSGLDKGLDETKKLLENGNVFKRIGKDSMGNPIVEGIKVAIKENVVEMGEQMEKAFSELNYKKQMSIVSESEYYKELENLRDTYLEKGSASWWKYTAKIVEYENKIVENQKSNIEKLTNEISENIEDKFDDVAKNVDSMMKKSVADYESKMKSIEKNKNKLSEKLSSYGGVYGTAIVNTGEEEKTYLENGVWKKKEASYTLIDVSDLKNEIAYLERYENALSTIKDNKNITREFFESFKKLDVKDGVEILESLTKLDDKQFGEYMSLWNEKNGISDKISDILYKDEESDAKSELELRLKEAFGEVDKTFLSDEGHKWAESFGDAFKVKISEMMEQVKSIISQKISDIEYSISLEKEKETSNTLVYNLYGSGETVSEKLKSARAMSELERLRGGY